MSVTVGVCFTETTTRTHGKIQVLKRAKWARDPFKDNFAALRPTLLTFGKFKNLDCLKEAIMVEVEKEKTHGMIRHHGSIVVHENESDDEEDADPQIQGPRVVIVQSSNVPQPVTNTSFFNRALVLFDSLSSSRKSPPVDPLKRLKHFLIAPESFLEISAIDDHIIWLKVHRTKMELVDDEEVIYDYDGQEEESEGDQLHELKIRFHTSDLREEWLAAIKREREQNYLIRLVTTYSLGLVEGEFMRQSYDALWEIVLSNRARFDFIRRSFMFSNSNDVEVAQNVVERILVWMVKLLHVPKLSEQHSRLFARFFSLALSNVAFRAMLSLVEPDDHYTEEWLKGASITESNVMKLDKLDLDSYVDKLVVDGPTYFHFLTVVDHPAAPQSRFWRRYKKPYNAIQTIRANELQWQNHHTWCIPFSFEKFSAAKEYPAFLAFYFLKETNPAIISLQEVDLVTKQLQKMRKMYFETSFRSFHSSKTLPVAKHFRQLARYCRYRKTWELLWTNQSIPQNIIDAVCLKLWDEMLLSASISSSDPDEDDVTSWSQFFLPTVIRHDLPQTTFQSALHAKILYELSTDGSQLYNVYEFTDVLVSSAETLSAEAGGGAVIHKIDLSAGGKVDLARLGVVGVSKKDRYTRGVQTLCNRIVEWIKALTDRRCNDALIVTDSILFVPMFILSIQCDSFRALLTLFLPSHNLVRDFVKDSSDHILAEMAYEQQCLEFVKWLGCIQGYADNVKFASFLFVTGHPGACVVAEQEAMVVVNDSSTPNGNISPVVNADRKLVLTESSWEKELDWYDTIRGANKDVWTLSWKELSLSFSGSPTLAFAALHRMFDDNNPTIVLKTLNGLPLSITNDYFDYFFSFDAYFHRSIDSVRCEKTSHFLSLLNYCRVRIVWKLILTDRLESVIDFCLGVQSLMWNAVQDIKESLESFVGILYLCTPMAPFPIPADIDLDKFHPTVVFADVIPGRLRVSYHELCHGVSELLGSSQCSAKITEMFKKYANDVASDSQHSNFQSYVDYLLLWTKDLCGCALVSDLKRQHSKIFATLLNAAIEDYVFRAVLLLFQPRMDEILSSQVTSDSVDDDDILKFVRLFVKRLKSFSSSSAFAYCLWLCNYPGSENAEKHTQSPWQQEMHWIAAVRPFNRLTLGTSELNWLSESPMYLPFQLICRHFLQLEAFPFMKSLPVAISALPSDLVRGKFNAALDYLPFDIHSAGELASKPLTHFHLLLRFQLFYELWKQFFVSPKLKKSNEAFVNATIRFVWNRMTKAKDNGLRALFFLPSKEGSGIVEDLELSSLIAGRYFHNVIQRAAKLASLEGGVLVDALFSALCIDRNLCEVSGKDGKAVAGNIVEDDDRSSFLLYIDRVVTWTQRLRNDKIVLDEEDAMIFVDLLSYSILDVGFRAFVTVFLPASSAAAEFCNDDEAFFGGDEATSLVELCAETLKSPIWRSNRTFMYGLRHYHVLHAGRTEECLPLWKDEGAWIASSINSDVELSWPELKLCFGLDPVLPYLTIKKANSVADQSVTLKHLPREFLSAQFEIDVDGTLSLGRHFVSFCLCSSIFDIFLELHQLSDDFLRELLRLALTNNSCPKFSVIYTILHKVVFVKGDQTEFNMTTLPLVPELTYIVLNALYEVVSKPGMVRDGATMCDIFGLLLRLEELAGSANMVKLLSSSPEQDKLEKVVRELRFSDWLADHCLTSLALSDAESAAISTSKVLLQATTKGAEVAVLLPSPTNSTDEPTPTDSVSNLTGAQLQDEASTKPSPSPAQSEIEPIAAVSACKRMNGDVNDATAGTEPVTNDELDRILPSPSRMHVSELYLLISDYFKVCLACFPWLFRPFIDSVGENRKLICRLLTTPEVCATKKATISDSADTLEPKAVYAVAPEVKIAVKKQFYPWRVFVRPMLDLFHWDEGHGLGKALVEGTLLYDNDHFSHDVLSALSLRANTIAANVTEGEFLCLLQVAMYFHQVDDLPVRLTRCIEWMLQSANRKRLTMRFLTWVIHSAVLPDWRKHAKDFSSDNRFKWTLCKKYSRLSIEDFLHFANHGTILSRYTLMNAESDQCLENLCSLYFGSDTISSNIKMSLMLYAKTVTFFIRKADSIDLEESLRPLEKLLQDLEDWTGDECNVFSRLVRFWMALPEDKAFKLSTDVRTIQLGGLLAAIAWGKSKLLGLDKSMGNCMVTNPGTAGHHGVMSAMLAIFYVKVLHKRVHILVHSEAEVLEEFKAMQSFYRLFNIIRRDGKASAEDPDLSHTTSDTLDPSNYYNQFGDFGVTYCTVPNIEQYFRYNKLQKVKQPLENCVLIVHSLDQLNINLEDAPQERQDDFFMISAPYLFSRYDCVHGFSQTVQSSCVDPKIDACLFNALQLRDSTDIVPSTTVGAESFQLVRTHLHRIFLGRRMNRLLDAFSERYGAHKSSWIYSSKEYLLKSILRDSSISHRDLDDAFIELQLKESEPNAVYIDSGKVRPEPEDESTFFYDDGPFPDHDIEPMVENPSPRPNLKLPQVKRSTSPPLPWLSTSRHFSQKVSEPIVENDEVVDYDSSIRQQRTKLMSASLQSFYSPSVAEPLHYGEYEDDDEIDETNFNTASPFVNVLSPAADVTRPSKALPPQPPSQKSNPAIATYFNNPLRSGKSATAANVAAAAHTLPSNTQPLHVSNGAATATSESAATLSRNTSETSLNHITPTPSVSSTTLSPLPSVSHSLSPMAIPAVPNISHANNAAPATARANFALASKQLDIIYDGLNAIRIGESIKVVVEASNEAQFRLSKLLRDKGMEELQGCIYDTVTDVIFDGVVVQGVLEVHAKTFSLSFVAKLVTEDSSCSFSPELYGKHGLRLKCRDCVVMDTKLLVRPSHSVLPFRLYTFYDAAKGLEICGGKVVYTFTPFSTTNTVAATRTHKELLFPPDKPVVFVFPVNDIAGDGIIEVTFSAAGYFKRVVQFVYFEKEIHDEDSRIAVCGTDLASDEVRVVLTWRALPSDLDLFCALDSHPEMVAAYNVGVGDRYDVEKGMIQFDDQDTEEREGYGPESITFTPLLAKKYRFYANNYSREKPLNESGARMCIFRADGSAEDMLIAEDLVSDPKASYWHAFDVVEGHIVPYNIVTADKRRCGKNCFQYPLK